MLMRGDFDLNAVQTDPVELLVRQALLKQEAVFGQQVHELHRRSSTRRSLGMVGNEFDHSYNSRNVKARSSCLPPRDATRYELLAKDARFSALAEVRSGYPLKQEIVVEDSKRVGYASSRPRSVSLQLSADDFIRRLGDDLRAEGSVRSDSFMNREEVKLSLGAGHRSRMPKSSTQFDYTKNSVVVIDLEDPIRDDFVKFSRMPGVFHGSSMQSTWLDRHRNLKSAVVIDLEDSVYKNKRSIDMVVIDLEDSPEINNDDVSAKGQWLADSVRGNLDLNEVYQEGNAAANRTLFDLNVDCESTEFGTEKECAARNNSGKCEIDNNNNNNNSLVQLKSKPLLDDLNHMPTGNGETSTGTSGVEEDQDRVSLSMEENGNKSPASCKSCISDNDSRTQYQSNINKCLEIKQEEDPVKVDTLIKRAAVSLLCLALDDDSPPPSKKEKPQHSLDSYEVIAMNLEHNIDVEDSASSGAFEVDFAPEDQGSKWKRGRRLKDFQREILPCLASLSRHEIREDINILEGVLRSREYRRMQAMAGGGGQQNEVKRKRARRNGNKPA